MKRLAAGLLFVLFGALSPFSQEPQEDQEAPVDDPSTSSERPEWVRPADPSSAPDGGTPQNPEWVPNRPETPERSVPDDAELHFLARQATGEDQSGRVESVRRIEALVREGRFSSDDPALVALLRRVALEPVLIDRRGAPSAGFPLARLQAVEALAHMSGPDVRTALLEVMRHEREPSVLAAALTSLAEINAFPDDQLSEAMVALMRRVPEEHLNGRLGITLLDTVRALDDVGSGIQHAELYRELVQLALHAGNGAVRTRAYEVVEMLRTKGRERDDDA